ncbi:MAG: hypothetical protein K0R08_413 [Solimicrobium sp.]|jgi:hypothetical protein|nr:hypothetical protein [Solimicrobium sp.]
MKLAKIKSALTLCLCLTATYSQMSNVYAGDAYLRAQDAAGNQSYSSYIGSGFETFKTLNEKYLGGAAYRTLGTAIPPYVNDVYKTFYIVVPGYQKRFGVFKLQRSMNGEKNGPREDLVFKTKMEANEFCTSLSKAAGDFNDHKIENGFTFVSDYYGGVKQVIAVAYLPAYEKGDLTPAKKHVFCKNEWKVSNEYWQNPDSQYFDENEITGVRASGFVDGNRGIYKVACMNAKPEATFQSHSGWVNEAAGKKRYVTKWTNNVDSYEAADTALDDRPTLEQLDADVGTPYCSKPVQ